MKHLSPLERAIKYIEEHLDEDIGLKDVSREMGYSYYHMTRLFSSALGETVGHYINRRRLYNASEKILYSNQRVIDIALECGFESSEAFSRAFKAVFGSGPVEYRKAGLNLVTNAKRELIPEDVSHIANNISHKPEILMAEEMKIAGIRGGTSISDNRIPELWEQFQRFYRGQLRAGGTGYSICETQQAAYTEKGDLLFSVIVGSSVEDFECLPDTLVEKILPAGKYAVFTHRGTLANLLKTYRYIFETWLPAAEEELDDREDFEVYEREVTSFDNPANEVKIYMPVK